MSSYSAGLSSSSPTLHVQWLPTIVAARRGSHIHILIKHLLLVPGQRVTRPGIQARWRLRAGGLCNLSQVAGSARLVEHRGIGPAQGLRRGKGGSTI